LKEGVAADEGVVIAGVVDRTALELETDQSREKEARGASKNRWSQCSCRRKVEGAIGTKKWELELHSNARVGADEGVVVAGMIDGAPFEEPQRRVV
jgi:hypothetical protein